MDDDLSIQYTLFRFMCYIFSGVLILLNILPISTRRKATVPASGLYFIIGFIYAIIIDNINSLKDYVTSINTAHPDIVLFIYYLHYC